MTVRRLVVLSAAVAAAAAPLAADDTGTGVPVGVEPSADEQFAIWKLNQARHDPPKYGNEILLDLTGVAPRPPLAVNMNLTGSARFKTQEMLDHDYFAHVSPVTGKGANQLAVDAGYDLFGLGLGHQWGAANNIESLAAGSLSFREALAGLIIDADPAQNLGHRIHLLAISPWAEKFREVGAGKAEGVRPDGLTHRYYAFHTGYVAEADTFLTGVVFFDLDGNGRFDVGEGLGGVTVDAGGALKTHSLAAGGWAIKVPPGIYALRCSGGTFQGVATARVGVTTASHEIDFSSGRGSGDIDFSGSRGRRVAVTALPIGGVAPLGVDLAATSDGPATEYTWNFGDGATGSGQSVHHVFGPGAWVVRAIGIDVGGVGGALAAVCADGPGGAGAGTSAPSSRTLKASAFTATVNHTTTGADSVTLTGKIEMPAGWIRGLSSATVVIAGVKAEFPLEPGKDAFKEPGRRSFKLTYKRPKHGAPLRAGVRAKVTVTVRGDLAAVLADLGIANRTEKRRLYGVPFLLTLGQLCWGTTGRVVATSVEGVASKAVLEKD